jgi:hypothetical protein
MRGRCQKVMMVQQNKTVHSGINAGSSRYEANKACVDMCVHSDHHNCSSKRQGKDRANAHEPLCGAPRAVLGPSVVARARGNG